MRLIDAIMLQERLTWIIAQACTCVSYKVASRFTLYLYAVFKLTALLYDLDWNWVPCAQTKCTTLASYLRRNPLESLEARGEPVDGSTSK